MVELFFCNVISQQFFPHISFENLITFCFVNTYQEFDNKLVQFGFEEI